LLTVESAPPQPGTVRRKTRDGELSLLEAVGRRQQKREEKTAIDVTDRIKEKFLSRR
jgi:hypothetical protein